MSPFQVIFLSIYAIGIIIALVNFIGFLRAPKGSEERADKLHSVIVSLITLVVVTLVPFVVLYLIMIGIAVAM